MGKKALEYRRPTLVGFLAMLLFVMLSGSAATGVRPPPEHFSQQLITATTLASAQLESLKTLGYRQLTAVSGRRTEPYDAMADFPTYHRLTSVEMDTPEPGIADVTVTVYWNADTNAVRLRLLVAE